MEKEMVIVLDYGGLYYQLIARRVRECNVYCEVKPYNSPIEEIKKLSPKGIIITGGPNSVYAEDALLCDKELFTMGVPILGICYGSQLMAYMCGGKVATAPVSEYGHAEVTIDAADSELFAEVPASTSCWMSHTDYISKMPEQSVLRLSDAYERKSEELDLELRIRFININPGYNEEMVEKSPTLYQYVKFVDAVRKYQQQIPFPEAVEKAIDECIKKGILAEFLRKNRAEVLRVSIFEYDEEEHMRQEREESRQEGFEESEKCGEVRIAKLIIELNRQGRTEDIEKKAAASECRKKLLEELHFDLNFIE